MFLISEKNYLFDTTVDVDVILLCSPGLITKGSIIDCLDIDHDDFDNIIFNISDNFNDRDVHDFILVVDELLSFDCLPTLLKVKVKVYNRKEI